MGFRRTHASIVEPITSVLGARWKRTSGRKAARLFQDFHELSLALRNFYHSYQLPPKDDFSTRPLISWSDSVALKVGMDYVYDHYRNFEYDFDHSRTGTLGNTVKKYLLFCDQLCILDPLPYLLDYFSSPRGGEQELRRTPAVASLLAEYETLKPLFEAGILLTASSEMYRAANHLPIPAEHVPTLASLANLEEGTTRAVLYEISEQQEHIQKLGNTTDFFFSDPLCVEVLAGLAKLVELELGKSDLAGQFGVSMLATIAAIDPTRVTLEDIVQLRLNEELYNEWRALTKHVLKRLYEERQIGDVLGREFATAVHEESASLRSILLQRKRESSVIGTTVSSVEDVSLGALSGALTGALTAPEPITGALVGATLVGTAEPLFKFVFALLRVPAKRRVVAALQRHYLAIGPRIAPP